MKKQVAIIDRYDRALIGQEDRTIQQVNSILTSSYEQIEKKLRGKWDSNTNLIPTQRQLLLADQIKDLYPFTNPEQAKAVQKSFKSLLASSSDNGQKLADELLKVSSPKNEYDAFTKKTAQLPIEAITQLAAKATDNLKRYSEEFKQTIINTVGFHLSIGSGISKAASSLRMALGITQSKAEMLVRTESLSAHNQATKQHYQENEVELFQYVATQDRRLCAYCGYRNMKIFKLGESQPPIHPRCRCTLTPYKREWEDLGLIDRAESDRFYENGLKQLGDKKPNPGQSPFEKLNNIPAPKPFVYTKPIPPPPPKATKKDADPNEPIKLSIPEGKKLKGRKTSTISELAAIGKTDGNLDEEDWKNIQMVRNGFSSREDFLKATPQELRASLRKVDKQNAELADYEGMGFVVYAGKRVQMTGSNSFATISKAPRATNYVEFQVDNSYDRNETKGAKPRKELLMMTRAYEEFEKSPVSEGILLNSPFNGDDFHEGRVKLYERFGFKALKKVKNMQYKNNTRGAVKDDAIQRYFKY